MSKDCWADADEREAMIAERDRLQIAIDALERARDAAVSREDSAHAYAKRLLGDGPNLMEIIRRAAVRDEELRSAALALLQTYLRPADPMWCGCCMSDVGGHTPDCAAAALVRVLSRLGEASGNALQAPPAPRAKGDGLDRLTRYMSDIESWKVLNAAAESRASKAEAALRGCVAIVDKAGLLNLSNGVQLGATSWYVKAADAFDYARFVLGAEPGTAPKAPSDPTPSPKASP